MRDLPLISIDTLAPLHAELVRRVELHIGIEVPSGAAGEALARSFLFERWPELLDEPPSQEVAFYNRYFWFVRFVVLQQAREGPNAGLEQQAFQMLEYAEIDIDWELAGELDKQARSPR